MQQSSGHSSEQIIYKTIEPKHIGQLQKLHDLWFPIKYTQSFYDSVGNGVWQETKDSLYTMAAVVQKNSISTQLNGEVEQEEQVVGAVVAQLVSLESFEEKNVMQESETHSHLMYILTIGSKQSHRRHGIATTLMQKCIVEASKYAHCGGVILHVKSDNDKAIRFYEKNGFLQLLHLKEHYVIEEKLCDAYLYVNYINGAEPPIGWIDLISRPFFAFITLATVGWKFLFGVSKETSTTSSCADIV